ncbi:MAG: ACT domain-containing protein [Planctomycetes bacterium]|nr:ACT domain-containing protein [Planctomycetota bacterium]
MEIIKQVSVFLENKPGRLANVLSALAREKVNLLALTVMDSHEHSVLRFVPSDHSRTLPVLKDLNIPYTEADVLQVELRNQPGALARVCELLGGGHINIDYAYCSTGGRNGKTLGILKVSNTDKAMRVLTEPTNNVGRRRAQPRPARNRRTYQVPGPAMP